MFRIAVSFFILGLYFSAHEVQAASCEQYVKSFTQYTQKVEGKMVKKHTITEIGDWARNSRFQGLLLTSNAPAHVEVSIESKLSANAKSIVTKAKKITLFSDDKKYRVIDLDLEKILGEAPRQEGYYIVSVHVGSKILCSEKKRIYNDGE